MKYLLNKTETLFRNRDVFESDFTPEILKFREDQIAKIRSAVQPGLRGYCPLSLVIRGLPGTGKTTAIRRIFHEIRESNQRLVPVYINSHAERSRFDVFAKIYMALHDHKSPHRGQTIRQLVDDLGRTISEREAVLLVYFEDANNLIPGYVLNDILESLLHLYKEHPKARVGFFLSICNMNIDLKQVLDSCITSVLQPDDVVFPVYKEEEVREILHDRITAGLLPGVISDEVFSSLMEHTMQCEDVRVGIAMLKRSVMAAERYGRSSVTKEDILGSFEVSKSIGADRIGCES
jgi:archaeal cell division control protein 6